MYSQNDEEHAILACLVGRNPSLLFDIGAHNGVRFSNSRALVEQGWRAVLVEPDPIAFTGLLKNTQGLGDQVECVNAAIVPNATPDALMRFWATNGDMIGTLQGPDGPHQTAWRTVTTFRPHWVRPVTMGTLLQQFGCPTFVTLDVEGQNSELAAELPWQDPKFICACIEYGSDFGGLVQRAKAAGFELRHRTGENIVLFRRGA